MAACDPATLMAQYQCWTYLDERTLLAIQAAILANANGMTIDQASELAKCFNNVDKNRLLAMIAALLCNGGSGGVTSGAVNPTTAPTSGNGTFYNTVDHHFLVWDPVAGSWRQLV